MTILSCGCGNDRLEYVEGEWAKRRCPACGETVAVPDDTRQVEPLAHDPKWNDDGTYQEEGGDEYGSERNSPPRTLVA